MDLTEHAGMRISQVDGDLACLAASLRALGLGVEARDLGRGAWAVSIDYPDHADARRFAKRGGRRRKPASGTAIRHDTPIADALAWLDAHTIEEGMEALGVSRSTLYRRRAAWESRLAEQEKLNAERDRRGMPPLVYLCGIS